MKRGLVMVVLTLCGLASTGCVVQATRDFTLTKPWEPYERVVVNSTNGRVELRCGKGDQVRIDGRKRIDGTSFADAERDLDAMEVVIGPDENDPKTLRIELHIPDTLADHSPGADLLVRVPTACAAELATSNGSICATDLTGNAVLETSNGRIEVEQVQGPVSARTSNGSIRAREIGGDLTARTSNGSIEARAIQGSCRLRTSNASIRVLDAAGHVQADTSNGSIRLEATPPEDAQIALHTSNASIEVVLPKQLKGELRLRTSNAGIHARLLNVPVEIRQADDDHLCAILNGGGAAAVVGETSNGSIRLDLR